MNINNNKIKHNMANDIKIVYVVIPFYSDNGINENDVIVFNKFEDADNYVNGLEGSPRIIETELK